MKFKIVQDFKGSPDGMRVEQYHAGTEVELTDSLAAVALQEGWAIYIVAAPVVAAVAPVVADAPAPTPARRGRKQ